jgi:tetratricopeptide (TPR) repeat protein
MTGLLVLAVVASVILELLNRREPVSDEGGVSGPSGSTARAEGDLPQTGGIHGDVTAIGSTITVISSGSAPSRQSPASSASNTGPVWNIPRPVRTFTGRDAELRELDKRLRVNPRAALIPTTTVAALHGMGGIGKTQLALAFADRYRARYKVGWWVPAETPLQAATALAALAVRLGSDPQRSQPELVREALDALDGREDWLLIFDNATTPAEVEPLLPGPDHGQVLITSRSPAWHGLADPIPVDLLTLEDAMGLLQARTDDPDRRTAESLARALDRLPLALEQAAAYSVDQQLSLATYLELFTRQRAQLLARGRPLAYQGTVDTTITLTVAQLSTAAAHLLRVCAVLAPDKLPVDQLLEHADKLGDPLALAASDPTSQAELLGELRRTGLLIVDPDGTGRIHRLVQAVLFPPLSERDLLLTQVIDVLAALWPADPDEPAYWPTCAQLLPHLDAVLAYTRQPRLDTPALARLLILAGVYVWARGIGPAAARELDEQALSMYRRLYGETTDHPSIATTLYNLAVDLSVLGDLRRARELDEQALAMCRRLYGETADHPDIARGLKSLGIHMAEEDDHKRARDRSRRSPCIGGCTGIPLIIPRLLSV